MSKLKFKMLHITPGDEDAWQLLIQAYEEGWSVRWDDYANRQFHFLLVSDE